jgi:hypothetical protein
MDFFVIRNKEKAEELCRQIMQRRLPFKVALQEVYPVRSIESNDYYWGIVVTPVANETGQDPQEVHDAWKIKFNFKYDLRYNRKTKKMQWYIGAASTTGLDDREIWEYIMKCRADAELELHLTIMMPNETFINELDFDFERKHKTKRI